MEKIVRNKAAGSICKRLAIAEGEEFNNPIIEFCYKDDALNDPWINDDHIINMHILAQSEIDNIKEITLQINKVLIEKFLAINISLIDFKIEFGKNEQGNIILEDEISPDSCRLWDLNTKEKMDKDRFRLDLGSLVEYYSKIAKRFALTLPPF